MRDYCCGEVYVVKVIWQTCCSKIVCSKEVIAVVTAITAITHCCSNSNNLFVYYCCSKVCVVKLYNSNNHWPSERQFVIVCSKEVIAVVNCRSLGQCKIIAVVKCV